MSVLTSDIKFYQRLLLASGFDPQGIDGAWGANTEVAHRAFLAAGEAIAADLGAFHSRSETSIRTLLPAVQRKARLFLQRLGEAGIVARIISGTRTYAEQDELYTYGRTKLNPSGPRPGKPLGHIVTRAQGGESNHNFGIAWDIGIFSSAGKYIPESPIYAQAGPIAEAIGLEWGKRWVGFPDEPHYQYDLAGKSLEFVRQRFENGTPYV